ncbi:flagellar biosynthesis protein FlgD [Oleiphilus sp. HI0009]|jgi:flagellar basal-body rod modification protein FlgD|uniref:flagellar hook assembly protein FlgD n=3 Tax=Oleiphilus TaxID=141450 RepID=UPI0007C2D460|nr:MULTISPECIES: flagellar hook assembly protein FlgD [unclassified Oleiphilus]KZX78697.1 flagellar biosynthesis protein FlgD [Oleiphilus sp. HI0009]MCH2159740.1 flagellar hook assembly protein FlgD [Oleiphilaceae bacterium]KZX82368.1 flagellar biosynthesis protein FlgD [Oleiphilus sp. HI0009]KZY64320.1 flagellar biosynthesis protein FlgD [Oleiphilus sp. HI0066]KZY72085.1 flagellar biosynthesis protein FlgD [Oleiphilus sp. HI0066]
MTSINTSGVADPLAQYRLENNGEAAKKGDLGKNEFLDLMIAQLENQNPLEPQDNGAFISQLAEFSALEEMQQINNTVNNFTNKFQSTQALQASAMVGRSVLVPGAEAPLSASGTISGIADIPSGTSNLSISILNGSGELVRRVDLGQQFAGSVPFEWDGLNEQGDQMPADKYTIKAEIKTSAGAEQVDTLFASQVNSVSIAQSGEVTLNLAGLGGVPLENVREIN